ncbi:hypothetical protein CBR_g36452 [Chara braunii]|uniref:CCHC-type domain-containing protein n=1 Tax=Chara braunii TaxID=69332 RepID=A0A388LL21_CHABU|nr:hypothetical protein CBR_g36452 [Chara braunii]|eukprot:GBG82925.1 hypothetical protein CBR_g36452 [Chara braunii]
MAASGNKCFNCGGEGHFARECPSQRQQQPGGGAAAVTPTTLRYWTPRRPQEDNEEREFLRQLIQEKRQEQARRRDLDEKRKMDELIKQEIERNSEALEARVLSKIGRQYLVSREEARRQELHTPSNRTPGVVIREREIKDYENRGVENIEDEIAMLYEIREEKRRKGKEAMTGGRRPFRQPVFHRGDGSGYDTPRAESSKMTEDRPRTKIPADSGPEGVLNYVLQQRRLLTGKNKDQLKVICAAEGVQYTTKAPNIEQIIEARVKLAYEGFIFTPAPTPAASPEGDDTPCK